MNPLLYKIYDIHSYVFLFVAPMIFFIIYRFVKGGSGRVAKHSFQVIYDEGLRDGDSVLVKWTNIEGASKLDEIRIFCPANDSNKKYIKSYELYYKDSIGKKSGEIDVPIYYPRSTCEFRSEEIVFHENLNTPLHIHIAFTEKVSEMRISWTSGTDLRPCVWYGELENNLRSKTCGTSSTYTANDMCQPIASSTGFIDPGFLHTVVLKNLKHDKNYFYMVGNEKEKSSIKAFKSQRNPNIVKDVSIVMFGDMDVTAAPGGYGTVNNMLNLFKKGPFDFILHVGDISYANGKGYVWDEFGSMIEPIASSVPYMMTIGNHEFGHTQNFDKNPSKEHPMLAPKRSYGDGSTGECGVPMYHRYKMPENGNSLFWYSFDYGNIKVITLCSEIDFRKESKQYQWFEKTLKEIDRFQFQWVIVTIHRPLYISATNEDCWDPASAILQEELEPLLIKYHVNFVISGHYHHYERTCYTARKNNWGTVHLIVGTAGRYLRFCKMARNEFHEKHLIEFGIGKLVIHNKEEATWYFVDNAKNQVKDEVKFRFEIT